MNKESNKSRTLSATQSEKKVGRRNLVKGLASSPLIFSIASRPVWAEPCTPSGERSLHPSATRHDPTGIGGCVAKLFSIESLRDESATMFWSSTQGIFRQSYFPTDRTFDLLTSTVFDLADGNGFPEFIPDASLQPPDEPPIEPPVLSLALSDDPSIDDETRIKTAILLNAHIWNKLVAILESSSIPNDAYLAIVDAGFYYKEDPDLVAANIQSEVDAWSGYVLI